MIKINQITTSHVIIIIISILNGAGFFGFNVDVSTYAKSPNSYWVGSEFIGGYGATLTAYGIHLGPFLTAFMLASALKYFTSSLAISMNCARSFRGGHLTLFLFMIFSWPFFVAYTNALRQGVSLALALFVLSGILRRMSSKSVMLIFIIYLFSHKSAIYYSPVFLLTYLSTYTFARYENFSQNIVLIFYAAIAMGFYSLLYSFEIIKHIDTYSTGFDVRMIILLLFFVFISFMFLTKIHTKALYFLSSFTFNLIAAILPFVNQSLVFERLAWLPFILSLILISCYLKPPLDRVYLSATFFLLAVTTLFVHIPSNFST